MKPYGSKRSFDTEPRIKSARALVKRQGEVLAEEQIGSETEPRNIQALIGVYFQTSQRFRHVCRLPPGETGVQALTRVAMKSRLWDAAEWAAGLGEAGAMDHYLRCYGHEEGHGLVLTREEWAEYKRLGGGTIR